MFLFMGDFFGKFYHCEKNFVGNAVERIGLKIV